MVRQPPQALEIRPNSACVQSKAAPIPRVELPRGDKVCRVPKLTSRSTVSRSLCSETWAAMVPSGVGAGVACWADAAAASRSGMIMVRTDTPFASDFQRLIEARSAFVETAAPRRPSPLSQAQ